MTTPPTDGPSVTADTITDEQLMTVRNEAQDRGQFHLYRLAQTALDDMNAIAVARQAMRDPGSLDAAQVRIIARFVEMTHSEALSECAAAWNARTGGTP